MLFADAEEKVNYSSALHFAAPDAKQSKGSRYGGFAVKRTSGHGVVYDWQTFVAKFGLRTVVAQHY